MSIKMLEISKVTVTHELSIKNTSKLAENKFSDGKVEIPVVEIIITETLHERSRKARLKTGHKAEDKLYQHDALCQK